MIVRRRLFRITRDALIVVVLLWTLFPLVWNILTSLKTRKDIYAIPPKLVFAPDITPYFTLLGSGGGSIWREFANSAIVAISTTLIVLVTSSLAAYALSRHTFRGKGSALFIILATRLLPPIVAVLPLFLIAASLRLVDTLLVLVVINTALNVPLATWILKQFFDTIPQSLEEAAALDGATWIQGLRRITIPLAAPGMASVAILVFIFTWNEFLFASLFTSSGARTLPLLLAEARGDEQIFFQGIAALSTILVLPVLVMSLLLQRHLVKGLTAGAID